MAMLGVTNYSKLPLRVATMLGFLLSALFLLLGLGYLIAKLVFWNRFSLGTAPLWVSQALSAQTLAAASVPRCVW